MKGRNEMTFTFSARSENEALARITIAAFVSQLDPQMDELNDIKTAVSEAVTNAIIHGYESDPTKMVKLEAFIENDVVTIIVSDDGIGIEDVELAKQPLFTSKPELERSGMGFTIMENFMDNCEIVSKLDGGTSISMMKRIESKKALYN